MVLTIDTGHASCSNDGSRGAVDPGRSNCVVSNTFVLVSAAYPLAKTHTHTQQQQCWFFTLRLTESFVHSTEECASDFQRMPEEAFPF